MGISMNKALAISGAAYIACIKSIMGTRLPVPVNKNLSDAVGLCGFYYLCGIH